MSAELAFLVSCEHAGNRVPPAYRPLFAGRRALLATHRGYDAGALAMARDLARLLQAPLHYATSSRLLIDLNRSIGHPRLYSEVTRSAPAAQRAAILQRYYLPYRHAVEAAIAERIARGQRVLHVSSHSFTPVLAGQVRNADIGLLYDPARPLEAAFSRCWQVALKRLVPALRVRRNYPYRGTSDGFTAYLRRRFTGNDYLGIELEISQRQVTSGRAGWRQLRGLICVALVEALQAEADSGR